MKKEKKDALQRILIDNIDLTRIFFSALRTAKSAEMNNNNNKNTVNLVTPIIMRRPDDQVLLQTTAIDYNKNSSMRTKVI